MHLLSQWPAPPPPHAGGVGRPRLSDTDFQSWNSFQSFKSKIKRSSHCFREEHGCRQFAHTMYKQMEPRILAAPTQASFIHLQIRLGQRKLPLMNILRCLFWVILAVSSESRRRKRNHKNEKHRIRKRIFSYGYGYRFIQIIKNHHYFQFNILTIKCMLVLKYSDLTGINISSLPIIIHL